MIHEPADIVRYLIIQLGHGTLPSSNGSWPVYISSEPDSPDNCITVFTTQGLMTVREMKEGVRHTNYGFQVRIRSKTEIVGYSKGREILQSLTESVLRTQVTIDSDTYLVHAITHTQSDVVPIGKDESISRRSINTFNAMIVYKPLS